jgi:hypothetical protein
LGGNTSSIMTQEVGVIHSDNIFINKKASMKNDNWFIIYGIY